MTPADKLAEAVRRFLERHPWPASSPEYGALIDALVVYGASKADAAKAPCATCGGDDEGVVRLDTDSEGNTRTYGPFECPDCGGAKEDR